MPVSILGFSEDFLDAEDLRLEEQDIFEVKEQIYLDKYERNELDLYAMISSNDPIIAFDYDVTFSWSRRILDKAK